MKMKRFFALALAGAMCLTLLAGCSKKDADPVDVDLAAFQTATAEAHPFSNNFFEVATLDSDEMGVIEMFYPGLADAAEEAVIYSSMVMQNSEMALVKAKDADSVKTVEQILNDRVTAMTKEGVNYPEVVEVWSTSSSVVSNGNYVMLIAHEENQAIVDEFNALFK